MAEHYKGIFKLTEECGEVLQIIGKLGPFPHGRHPDGGEDLRVRLEKELADLQAAILYFQIENKLNPMKGRREVKLANFKQWGMTGIDDGEFDLPDSVADHLVTIKGYRTIGHFRNGFTRFRKEDDGQKT